MSEKSDDQPDDINEDQDSVDSVNEEEVNHVDNDAELETSWVTLEADETEAEESELTESEEVLERFVR